MTIRSATILFSSILLASAMGCAGGLPAVVTSSVNGVSVEFSNEGSVAEAGKLAKEECKKHGRVPDFDAVDSVASPKSRVAKFRCVDPAAASAPAGADDGMEK